MLLNKVIINICRVCLHYTNKCHLGLKTTHKISKIDHVLFKGKHIKSTLNLRLNLQKWDVYKDLVDISKGESSLAVPVCFHFASPGKKPACQVDYCLINLKPTTIVFSSKHVWSLQTFLDLFFLKCCWLLAPNWALRLHLSCSLAQIHCIDALKCYFLDI